MIDDSTDCSSLARKTSTKPDVEYTLTNLLLESYYGQLQLLVLFSYTGSSSKCTKSEISTTCPASNWKLSEKKAYTSGSSAKATASFKQYKKMYIFKQLQELLLLVVINLENYINSKIG